MVHHIVNINILSIANAKCKLKKIGITEYLCKKNCEEEVRSVRSMVEKNLTVVTDSTRKVTASNRNF